MKVKMQFIIFFLMFVSIYLVLNSYVVLRLGGLLGMSLHVLYVVIVIVTLAMPLSVYIAKISPNIFSRIFYTLAVLWMGVMLFLLCTLLLYEIIRPFYVLPHVGVIILSLVVVLSLISIFNASFFTVKEVTIPIKGLEHAVTIVQLSDIHMGTIRNVGYLTRIVARVNDIDPDIVMITGDMIDASVGLRHDMFRVFDGLRAPVYFVTGNHEVYEGVDNVYALFNDTNIQVLHNEVVLFDGIQIVGITYSQEKNHLARELEALKINRTMPTVLMYHSPQDFADAKKAGIDLQLSGHTHYGQIFPFNFLVKVMFSHIKGLYTIDGMFVYVSPGTGTWGPYMRLGSRNEITLLRLVPR